MRGFSPGGQLPQPRGRGLFPALFNRRPKVELDDQIYLVEGAEHGEAGVKLMLIKDNGEVPYVLALRDWARGVNHRDLVTGEELTRMIF